MTTCPSKTTGVETKAVTLSPEREREAIPVLITACIGVSAGTNTAFPLAGENSAASATALTRLYQKAEIATITKNSDTVKRLILIPIIQYESAGNGRRDGTLRVSI